MRKIMCGVVIGVLLAGGPAYAIDRKSILDGLRRWEHGSFCQGMFQRGWETVAFFVGC